MKEPFPSRRTNLLYNNGNITPAAGRTVQNSLWTGRKISLWTLRASRCEGQVVEWKQWMNLASSGSPNTFWSVKIRLDDEDFSKSPPNISPTDDPSLPFQKGDLVKIHNLVKAKEHNGKEATVQKYMPETGRFLVQYGPQKKKEAALHQADEYRICTSLGTSSR